MSKKAAVEYVLDAVLFLTLPSAGSYITCPGRAGTALLLSTVRKIGGDTRPLIRLIGLRVRAKDIPAGVTPFPWPREHRPVGRPSRAAMPPAPSDKPAIVTRAAKAKAERDRVRKHRIDSADVENRGIEPVRRKGGTVVEALWRDPDDTGRAAVMRGHSKEVRGFRNATVVDSLVKSGTIRRSHARAAGMFLGQFEKAQGLGLGSVDLGAPKVGYSSGIGPSETQIFSIEAVRNVRRTLGRLWDIVIAVVVENLTLKEFARRSRTNPTITAGRFIGAMEVLDAWYSEPEAKERATIGAQLGDDAPLAARKWAAD